MTTAALRVEPTAAVASVLLFRATTSIAKQLFQNSSLLLLAGLLHLGSGAGLTLLRLLQDCSFWSVSRVKCHSATCAYNID